MDVVVSIGEFLLNKVGWLAGLAVAFGILGRLTPCNPGMYWWKNLRAAGTDLVYWLAAPLVGLVGRALMLLAAAWTLVLIWGDDARLWPLKDLPLWQQCVAVALIQDVLLYWLHRAFHTRRAWQLHATHHSPTTLDWMSAARFHPVNVILQFTLADVAVLLMGFSPAVFVVMMPLNVVYSAMVHANLNWTFGPLRHVFASPVFHRWHHTAADEGLDKNFAPTFPVLDVIFGTFYMPPGRLPEQFGNGDPAFPEGFWGQLVYPLRRRARNDGPPPAAGSPSRREAA
jgi:sterol desaturase/sphingolipid hydroxylase (fatty acid hydroxylase superfamily)